MNIHSSLKFITQEQLSNGINFLYFALKQALKSRGSDLIVQQEETNDGIVVYHNLIQKYRYGGDMETYKAKLLKIMYTNYHTGYPGGGIAYLDDWEDAITKYENIAPDKANSSEVKRSIFATQFTVINDTDFLTEQVRDSTTEWDQFANSLRTKLARRKDLNSRSASSNARGNARANNYNTIN